MVLQSKRLSSYMAPLVCATPEAGAGPGFELIPCCLATVWPYEPPPWTTTTFSSHDAISSERADTTSGRYENGFDLSVMTDPPSFATTVLASFSLPWLGPWR